MTVKGSRDVVVMGLLAVDLWWTPRGQTSLTLEVSEVDNIYFE